MKNLLELSNEDREIKKNRNHLAYLPEHLEPPLLRAEDARQAADVRLELHEFVPHLAGKNCPSLRWKTCKLLPIKIMNFINSKL